MASWSNPVSPLGQFLGGYLHQDWNDEYPDAWSAVQAYVQQEPLEDRVAARTELVAILNDGHDDSELSDAMDRVGMEYHPPGDGITYREWMEKVETYLREHED